VAVAAHHDLGAGTVVAQEDSERVFKLFHGFDLVQDATNFDVDAVDHSRVNGHLLGLEFSLGFGRGNSRAHK